MPYIGKKPADIIATAVDTTTGTFSGAVSASSVDADGGVTVDNITIDGTEIDLSSGNLTLDVAGQLVINSDSGQVVLQDDTVNWGNLQNSSGDFIIGSLGADKDLKIQGLDSSSTIDALTFDMSEAGAATFNSSVTMSTSMTGQTTDGQFEFISKDTSGSGSTDYGDFTFKGVRGADGDSVTIMNMDGATGRVGINTTSMAEPLRVQADSGTDFSASGTAFNNALMLKNSTSGASNCISLAMATESNGEVYLSTVQNSDNDAADFAISTRDSGSRAERLRLQSDGKFSVGSSTPESGSLGSFHSNGAALYQLALVSTNTSGTQYHQQFIRGSTQAGYITSSASQTVTLHNTSDERLKENIQDSDSATQSIKDIKVRKFNWKNNSDITIDYGFIAQELIKCVPEAVHEGTDEKDENGNYRFNWGVGYANLVPRLVKTIQELEARITALEGA